ncbi:IS21 family transposase [Thalassoglobus sp.]|uniref:IS21 family transposase n=1 Tax=Thalassoglobus sp. TaxID=2795869 RepID=UPI003AA7B853
MFTDMQKWAEIRRRVLTGEISKRGACREYGIHWETLEKILTFIEPPGYRLSQPRGSKIDPYMSIIEEILKSDKKVHRKQRHTAQRIFERLRDEHGYSGGYTIVSTAVRKLKQQDKEVFLPLSHPPGEAQVDYGYADVVLNGEKTKVALFVMTLPYSDAICIQAFPRECTESFQEGHVRAFEFFGGVPTRISYDNSKVAVGKIVGNREREVTKEFLRLKSHFLYEDHFCLVRRPNEKGHVERLLDFARRSFLVPVPQIDSLEALNEQLLASCEKDLERTLRGKAASKRELLKEEQQRFLSNPKEQFEAKRLQTVHANSLSLIRFDRNSYSVPTDYAHRSLTVVASVDEVRIVCAEEQIASHPRCWEKEQFFFNPLHYLQLLERKPGGFDHAKPFEDWELPVCFGILRRRMESEPNGLGTREFIKVLQLLERHSLATLTSAVRYALEIGTSSAEAILLILQYQQEPAIDLFCLDGRPHLKQVNVQQTNVSAYQSLLTTNPERCSVS